MADTQNSSFIPKAPVRAEVAAPRSRRVYVLTYISFVLFFGVLIATVIVFFLGFQQDKEQALQQDRLEQEQAKFNDGNLEEVRELHTRLGVAKDLINKKVSVVSILASLEYTVLHSVTVTGFTITKQEDGNYLLELVAESPQFNATLFQRELISGNPILAGASISEVQYGSVMTEGDDKTAAEKSETVVFKISKVLTVEDFPHVVNPVITGADTALSESLGGGSESTEAELVSDAETETVIDVVSEEGSVSEVIGEIIDEQ